MDPNNNQPLETNPTAQPVSQPASSVPPVASPAAPTPSNLPQTEPNPAAPNLTPSDTAQFPKGNKSKIIILLVILLLLILGVVAYVLFAKNQINNNQKATTDNTSTVLPTPTLVPTLAPQEDLEVASPQADLLELEADVKGL